LGTKIARLVTALAISIFVKQYFVITNYKSPRFLNWNKVKKRASVFNKEWEHETSEKAEAKSFWDGFQKPNKAN